MKNELRNIQEETEEDSAPTTYLALLKKKQLQSAKVELIRLKDDQLQDSNSNSLKQLKAKRAKDLEKKQIISNPNVKQPKPSVRFAGINPESLKLSEAIQCYPHLVEPFKLNLAEKSITEIDSVPSAFQNVETLFLSGNNIQSLEGISQFSKLKVLSIANNKLEDLDELNYLSSCSNLSALNLESNPICYVPNYRYHVIVKLKKLRLLDNKEVSVAERSSCDQIIKKEETMMSLLISNVLLVQKLKKGIEKLALHDELVFVARGRLSVLNRPDLPDPKQTLFDIKKLLQFVAGNEEFNQQNITRHERMQIVNDLRTQVRTNYNKRVTSLTGSGKELPQDKDKKTNPWDVAFSEVLLSQQNEIADLLTQIDQIAARKLTEISKQQGAGLIYNLRNQTEQTQQNAKMEREALILEFRNTINNLISDFRTDYGMQASQYQSKIQTLQDQITQLTENPEPPKPPAKEPLLPSKTGAKKSTQAPSKTKSDDFAEQAPKKPRTTQPDNNRIQQTGQSQQNVNRQRPLTSHKDAKPRGNLQQDYGGEMEFKKVAKIEMQDEEYGDYGNPHDISMEELQRRQEPKRNRSAEQNSQSRDIEMLLEEVEKLRNELTHKKKREETLMNLNIQLKARLEQYQRQNEDNARNAETELLMAHERAIEDTKVMKEMLENEREERDKLIMILDRYDELEVIEEVIQQRHQFSVLHKYFQKWKAWTNWKHQESQYKMEAALQYDQHRMLKQAFRTWRNHSHEERMLDMDVEDLENSRDESQDVSAWRNQMLFASDRFDMKLKKKYFQVWKSNYMQRKTEMVKEMQIQKAALMVDNRHRYLELKRIFHAWQLFVWRKNKKRMMKQNSGNVQHFQQMEGHNQQLRSENQELRSENQNLHTRLHSLSKQYASLELDVSEKNSEIIQLSQKLDNEMEEQYALQKELKQLQYSINSLKQQSDSKDQEIQMQKKRSEQELANYKKLVSSMQSEAEERDALLKSYERRIQEHLTKTGTDTSQSQQRLQSAFEIAASLRKLLDEKDYEISQYKNATESSQAQLIAYQSRLDEANQTIEDLRDRLSDTHNITTQYVNRLESREQQVSRLADEVKLMHDRENVRAHKMHQPYATEQNFHNFKFSTSPPSRLYPKEETRNNGFAKQQERRHGNPRDQDLTSPGFTPVSNSNTKSHLFDEINLLQSKINKKLSTPAFTPLSKHP